MNIILLGKNGQVGWELQRALQPLGTLSLNKKSRSITKVAVAAYGLLTDRMLVVT